MNVKFEVYGKPIGKGRPRFSTRGGAVRTFTLARTASYEHQVQDAFLRAAGPVNPCDGVATVSIRAFFQAPKAMVKAWEKLSCDEMGKPVPPYPSRPDADNIAKIVCDALNGVAWTDDSRVTDLVVCKRYSLRPRVEVSIVWEDAR